MSGMNTTTSNKLHHLTSRCTTIGLLTLAILGGSLGLATNAGAATTTSPATSPTDEAELGTSMSASMSVDENGDSVMIITEVATDGTVTTVTIPTEPKLLGTISGIDDARRLINLAAM